MSTFSPFSKEELLPQTEMLEIKKQKGELFIGLPKETLFEEKRICKNKCSVGWGCAKYSITYWRFRRY